MLELRIKFVWLSSDFVWSLDLKDLLHKLWVHSQCFQSAGLKLLMTVPVGSLREHFEAATAWEWLLARVWSKVVPHGGLLGEAVSAGVTDQPLLEPPGVCATLSDHLEGCFGWFSLLNFFRFRMLTSLAFDHGFSGMISFGHFPKNLDLSTIGCWMLSSEPWNVKSPENRSDLLLPLLWRPGIFCRGNKFIFYG